MDLKDDLINYKMSSVLSSNLKHWVSFYLNRIQGGSFLLFDLKDNLINLKCSHILDTI